jgi:hypothetical protein
MIPLFTSIPRVVRRPFRGRDYGVAWQTACIQSWKASGFHVLSLNTAAEINELRSRVPVDFLEIPVERKRPMISDFLDAARDSGCTAAGIINADCLIVNQNALINHIAQINGVVVAERINLSQTSLHPTGQTCYGFDALFFSTKASAEIPRDERWHIGDPWWDYWLPLAFHVAGFELNTWPAPMMMHFDHERIWDLKDWERNFDWFLAFLRAHVEKLSEPPALATAIAALSAKRLQHSHIEAFSHTIYNWIRSRDPLWVPEAGSAEDFLSCLLGAIATPVPRPPLRRRRAYVNRILDLIGIR